MIKLTRTSLATILVLSATGFAAAQTGVNAGGGASVGVGTGGGMSVDAGAGTSTSVDAGTNAGGGADMSAKTSGGASSQTYGSVVSALNSSGGASADLSAVTDSTTINIIPLSSLKGEAAANAEALDKALSEKSSDLTTLRTKIDANAALKAKLEADGHASDDVVAVTSEADGSLNVYIDDRS
jgi:hypothetical protein